MDSGGRYGKVWDEGETLVAMYFYLMHYREPGETGIATSRAMSHLDRSEGSIKRKFANFASLDPRYSGKGLPNSSKIDVEIWDRYVKDPGGVTREILGAFGDAVPESCAGEWYATEYRIGGEIYRNVKTRVGQDLFRRSVVGNFGDACCLTGIADPRLLRAGHIKPWRDCSDFEKTDPRNGLCLNTLHDAAFDRGLMTLEIDEEGAGGGDSTKYRVVFSSELAKNVPEEAYRRHFLPYDGKIVSGGVRYELGEFYLDHHRKNVFIQKA